MSANAIPSSCEASATACADEHLAGPRVVGDPRGEVHGLAEVVALLIQDRPRVQSDVGRRQSGGREPAHHLERGAHTGAGVGEVEHHAVAQPLDGLAAVPHGVALHQPRDRRGQVGGRVVAAFLGQPRVAGEVEEADRREPFEAAVDPRLPIITSNASMMLAVQSRACCAWYMARTSRSVSGGIRSERSAFPTLLRALARGRGPARSPRSSTRRPPARPSDGCCRPGRGADARSPAGRNPSASCISRNGTIAISSSRSRSSGEGAPCRSPRG